MYVGTMCGCCDCSHRAQRVGHRRSGNGGRSSGSDIERTGAEAPIDIFSTVHRSSAPQQFAGNQGGFARSRPQPPFGAGSAERSMARRDRIRICDDRCRLSRNHELGSIGHFDGGNCCCVSGCRGCMSWPVLAAAFTGKMLRRPRAGRCARQPSHARADAPCQGRDGAWQDPPRCLRRLMVGHTIPSPPVHAPCGRC